MLCCGTLPKLWRIDIADTHVLCSAVRKGGNITVNCRLHQKAGCSEICILTATVAYTKVSLATKKKSYKYN